MDESDWEIFTTQLDQDLAQISVPGCKNCNDVHCKNEDHIQEIDNYAKDVLEAVDRCINSVAKKKRKQYQKCQSCTRMERCCKAILRGSKILAFHLDISW